MNEKMRGMLPFIDEDAIDKLLSLLKDDAKVQKKLLSTLIRLQNKNGQSVTLQEVLDELPEIKKRLQNHSRVLGRLRGLKKKLVKMGASYELNINEKSDGISCGPTALSIEPRAIVKDVEQQFH